MKASMRGFNEKQKLIAGQIAISLLSNPFYRDMHVDLVENTAAYLVRRIVQFRYTDDYVEEMLELFHDLKSDFYASEQYRKDSFSFKSFAAMMRLSHKRLVESMRDKKRKLNDQGVTATVATTTVTGNQGEDVMKADDSVKTLVAGAAAAASKRGFDEKKIIDHEEFMSIDYKFNYTQGKDPLIKELHRLM